MRQAVWWQSHHTACRMPDTCHPSKFGCGCFSFLQWLALLLQRLYLAKHLLEAFLLRGWCHLLCSACPAWCCRMIPVVTCDDLALYRRISLYRCFLSSGFILSTSAAIILPWYTMDLKNLEAFLPRPRQASERGVCPLAGSKWGSAFDTVQCLTFACQKQMHLLTHHLHLLTPTRHRPSSSPPTNATRFESGVVVFSLNQLHERHTEQYKCLAMRCLLSYYDILYLRHIIIHGLLCGTESMWIQVSKSI